MPLDWAVHFFCHISHQDWLSNPPSIRTKQNIAAQTLHLEQERRSIRDTNGTSLSPKVLVYFNLNMELQWIHGS